MSEIKPGIYRHYKGNRYRVICIAKHSETLEDMIIYQDVSDLSKIWARPTCMWNETVEVEGRSFKRFEMEDLTMADGQKV